MAELRIVTLTGTDSALDEAVVEQFASRLRGGLLRSGDAEYEEARQVWNGVIDRQPALIARCRRCRRRHRLRKLRPRERPAGGGARRRSQRRRHGQRRRRPGHRPLGHEGDRGGPGAAHGTRRGRRHHRRAGRGDAEARDGDAYGRGLRDGHRRSYPQRRHGPAEAQARPLVRQPRLRGRGHRRRPLR